MSFNFMSMSVVTAGSVKINVLIDFVTIIIGASTQDHLLKG